MAIKVGQAFERTSAQPIDTTLTLTKAQMKTVNDNLMPDYYFTICQEDGKIYLYDKSKTNPSAITGKFDELQAGGGEDTPFVYFSNTPLEKTMNRVSVVEYSELETTDATHTSPTTADLIVGKTLVYDETGTMGVITQLDDVSSEATITTATTSKHIILDNDGTAMTQRGKLQFTGLDVADDSMNNITEIKAFGLNTDSIEDVVSGDIAYNEATGPRGVSRRSIWYVDADNGDDSNNGLTITTPFKSIQKAVDMAALNPGYRSIYSDDIGGDQIYMRANTTNPYKHCRILGKTVNIHAWDFDNNVTAVNTGTLTFEDNQQNPTFCVRYGSACYFYAKDVNITNTNTTSSCAVQVADHSSLWFVNSDNSIARNFTLSGRMGLEVSRNGYASFQGTIPSNSMTTIIGTGTSAVSCSRNSSIDFESNINFTCDNSSTVYCYENSIIMFNMTGSSASNIGSLTIKSLSGNGGAIQTNINSIVADSGNHTLYLENSSTTTTSTIHAARNSEVHLNATGSLNIKNNSNSTGAVRAYNCSGIYLGISSATGTNAISSPTTAGSNYTIAASGGKIILPNAVTITGSGGLQASWGGQIAYNTLTNNATTKTNTNSGGRIYSGTQTSIPNY